jgi:phosphatidylglycerophosphatase A
MGERRLPQGISFWHPATLIATWFGTGLLPKAPGTWGSLAAVPCAWVIYQSLGPAALAAASILAFLGGWWACAVLAKKGAEGDPGVIVIDEIAGQWLTLTVVAPDLLFYVTGFALFRFFDIVKPWPVSWAERRVAGPLGVMVDDMLAGLYAAAGLWFIHYYSLSAGNVS